MQDVVSNLFDRKSDYSFLIQRAGQTVLLPSLQPHAVLTVSGLYEEDEIKGATLLSSYVTVDEATSEASVRRFQRMVGTGKRQSSGGRSSGGTKEVQKFPHKARNITNQNRSVKQVHVYFK